MSAFRSVVMLAVVTSKLNFNWHGTEISQLPMATVLAVTLFSVSSRDASFEEIEQDKMSTVGMALHFMCLADKPMVRSYHLRDYEANEEVVCTADAMSVELPGNERSLTAETVVVVALELLMSRHRAGGGLRFEPIAGGGSGTLSNKKCNLLEMSRINQMCTHVLK